MADAQNQVPGGGMGMRGGADCHMRSISAGVRASAWLTRSLKGAVQGQGSGGEDADGFEGALFAPPFCQ